MFLAQGTCREPVPLEPMALWSRVKYSTTQPLRSLTISTDHLNMTADVHWDIKPQPNKQFQPELTLGMTGNFSCLCCCPLTFSKLTLSKNYFRVSDSSDPDVRPEFIRNCLQKVISRLQKLQLARNEFLPVTSHINYIVALCRINVVYLTACAFIRS